MIPFKMLCFGLESAELSRTFVDEGVRDDAVLILPGSEEPSVPSKFYVGTGEQIANLILDMEPGQPLTAFAAGPLPVGLEIPGCCNVASYQLSLSALHNRLSLNLSRYAGWKMALSAEPLGQDYPARLLHLAASLTGFSFFLLDGSFQLIASGQPEDAALLPNHIDPPQQNTPAQISRLLGRLLADGEPMGASGSYQVTYRSYSIGLDMPEPPSYLFVAEYGQDQPVDLFSTLLVEYLARYLRTREHPQENPADPLWALLHRMRIFNPQNPNQITENMRQLQISADVWIRFLLIDFVSGRGPTEDLFQKIRSMFQGCSCTIYHGRIVVLISSGTSNLAEKEAERIKLLENLLAAEDGYAIVSNACRMESGMRTEYIVSDEVLDMLPQLHFPNESRCSPLNRYLSYYCIHLCASHLEEKFGHDRLVYFAYPEILKLTRYDLENGTDLRNLLFYYVANNCNVNTTASLLYMHRNTVFNKINKIKELTGLNLDSGLEKAGILHSCQVLRYIECVQKQAPSLLPESSMEYLSHRI